VEILYVSQYFPPESCAPAARVHELSRSWVQAGAGVTVLTAFPNHPGGILPREYRGKLYAAEEVDGIRIHRTFIYPAANKEFWGRILNYGSFAASALVTGALKLKTADVVVATSPQFLVALSGFLLAKLLGAPFVFEVRDLWPASIVAVGALKEGSLLVAMLGVLERFLYRRAHHIVVVTDSCRRLIAAKGIPESKISVSRNGVDLNAFYPGPKPQALLRRHALEGKFVVSYIGTIGMAHGVRMLLDAAERMQREPDIHFVVVGEGAESAGLAALAKRKGLRNLTFLGAVPRSEVREWIAASDVCAVVLRDRPLFRTVVPSKMFEFMACARPLIVAVAGEAAQLLERAGAGIPIAPEDLAGFCSAVLALKRDPALREDMGNSGRRFVEENFDREAQARRYLAMLAALKPPALVPPVEAGAASPHRSRPEMSAGIQ